MSDIAALQAALHEHASSIKSFTSEMRQRLLEVEQKLAGRAPGGGGGDGSGDDKELADLIVGAAGVKAFLAGNSPVAQITVRAGLLTKTQIINATGSGQPLVAADRRPGIVAPPEQRLTVRGLLMSQPTDSNLVEFCQEATFTSNAAVQGDTSPGGIEGERKAESAMTFTLGQVAVVTIAHWIPASRQVLSDSVALQGHLSNRLLYGVALKEEGYFLTGDGTAGTPNGINNQASAFNGGATNQTALDTLLKGINQLAVGNFDPSGIILHPSDWTTIRLAKDTTGRYILGDPAAMQMPSAWGLPVVPTVSQTQGRFTVLDARRLGYIADRETATIRISEHHDDFFVRNMIAVLAENRVALVIERPTAAVYGLLNTAG